MEAIRTQPKNPHFPVDEGEPSRRYHLKFPLHVALALEEERKRRNQRYVSDLLMLMLRDEIDSIVEKFEQDH